MKRMRLAWMICVIAAMLLAGCARGPAREEGAGAIAPIQQAITEANLAAEAVKVAAQKGDLAQVGAAYKRFSAALGQVLGPVSFEDPQVAQKMANANSAIKAMVSKGKVEPNRVAHHVAIIQLGLQESVRVMARSEGAAAPAVVAGGQQGGGRQEQTVDVTAVDYRFQPPAIRVKKGSTVTIRFTNKGTERHEFEIEEFDFEIGPIQPGQVVTKAFVAEKAGRFFYECHVDDHLARGMRGTLIVEE